MWSILLLVFLSLCVGIGVWLFFLWTVKSGQYEDTERAKHRMFDEDEDQ